MENRKIPSFEEARAIVHAELETRRNEIPASIKLKNQEQFDEHVQVLSTVDFSDIWKVLDWLSECAIRRDACGVDNPHYDEIKVIFGAHEITPDESPIANPEDPVGAPLQLCRQALAALTTGGILINPKEIVYPIAHFKKKLLNASNS